jgi:hypothetical protein
LVTLLTRLRNAREQLSMHLEQQEADLQHPEANHR